MRRKRREIGAGPEAGEATAAWHSRDGMQRRHVGGEKRRGGHNQHYHDEQTGRWRRENRHVSEVTFRKAL